MWPGRRIGSGPWQRTVPADAVLRGVRICVSFVGWLALIEISRAVWAATQTHAPPSRTWLVGLLAGVGLSLPLGASIGIVLGALLWMSGPRASGHGRTAGRLARVWSWSWQLDPIAQPRRLATTLGALPPLGLFVVGSFYALRVLVVAVAQPTFAALAMLGVQALIAAVCASLYPASRNAAAFLLPRPPLSWCFERVGSLLSALTFVLLLVCAIGAWHVRTTLEYLPWDPLVTVSGAIILAGIFSRVARRSRVLCGVGWLALALLTGVSATALRLVDARDPTSRTALESTLGGRVGYAASVVALDFDRDGALGVLGGGDCAPFDRRRGPNAIDVPNNGRDEDCDGIDLDGRVAFEVERRFPVPAAFPKRPTVLLITVDAFAAGRMRALGYPRSVTPVLDAFAARSTLFRHAYSQGPSTRLSFPSMFTSRWDSQIQQQLIGKHPYPIDDSEKMLAEVLAGEGYDTVAIISEPYFRKSRWGSLTAGFAEVIESPIRPTGQHNSVAVTDAALEVLGRKRTRPLFLWAHYFDAHPPNHQPAGIERFGKTRSDLYDAELKLVDRELGRLLGSVTAPGAAQPLVMVTGDHGIAFDAPRHTKFNYGYDLTSLVLHVPLIVHGPGVRAQAFDHLVSTMDIAPTITNLLRVQQTLPFEGASLVPELLEGRPTRPQRLLHQMFLQERLYSGGDPLDMVALRTERFNLIHDRGAGRYELYAFRTDPGETTNLVGDPRYKATLRGLKQQLALYTYRLHARDDRKTAGLTANSESGQPTR